MGRGMEELASYMRPLCKEFFALALEAGIHCTLIDTGRTSAEQTQKLLSKVSWTPHSKHLPQPPEDLSEAFDVCPTEYLVMKGWNPTGDLWPKLGDIGESLGLEWGGRWPHNPPHSEPDPGHFQWNEHPNPNINLDAGDN